jgi:hypothetical protein
VIRSSGQATAMIIAWLVIQDEFAPMGIAALEG